MRSALSAQERAYLERSNVLSPCQAVQMTKIRRVILASVKRFCHGAQPTYAANFRFT